jgi:hypothetical protein
MSKSIKFYYPAFPSSQATDGIQQIYAFNDCLASSADLQAYLQAYCRNNRIVPEYPGEKMKNFVWLYRIDEAMQILFLGTLEFAYPFHAAVFAASITPTPTAPRLTDIILHLSHHSSEKVCVL